MCSSDLIARMVVETFHQQITPVPDSEKLSRREEAVLLLLAEGLVNKEIGEQLHIAKDTVRAHLRKIYEKLHVRCRIEAVNEYLKRGGPITQPDRSTKRANKGTAVE